MSSAFSSPIDLDIGTDPIGVLPLTSNCPVGGPDVPTVPGISIITLLIALSGTVGVGILCGIDGVG